MKPKGCVGLVVDVWFWLCVSLLFPSSLWNHAQLGGGRDAVRLMSTLAYGWVERCSDVASCGPASLKISILVLNLCKLFVLGINMNMFGMNEFYFCCRMPYAFVYIFMFNAFYLLFFYVHGNILHI